MTRQNQVQHRSIIFVNPIQERAVVNRSSIFYWHLIFMGTLILILLIIHFYMQYLTLKNAVVKCSRFLKDCRTRIHHFFFKIPFEPTLIKAY